MALLDVGPRLGLQKSNFSSQDLSEKNKKKTRVFRVKLYFKTHKWVYGLMGGVGAEREEPANQDSQVFDLISPFNSSQNMK